MDYSKPTLIVISGPNGAGKSTYIQLMLPPAFEGIWSFDRDMTRVGFEKLLAGQGIKSGDLFRQATAMMEQKLLLEMRKAISLKEHFVLETPLSHPDYWAYIDLFERGGYQIQLNYLCLDNVSDCVARVEQRVIEGGHYVEPSTIKGVYEKNLEYINAYKDTFGVIELYDGMAIPTLLARIENNKVIFAVKQALTKNWIRKGLPSLTVAIKLFLS
jgi:predicted ABC-type ATPase